MMMPSLKNYSLQFRQITICLGLLLAFATASGQQKHCSYQNFWFKADYKNLKHAENEMSRYDALIKTKGLDDSIYAKAQNIAGIYHDYSGNSEKAIACYKKAL